MGHIKTITRHKMLVTKLCFKCGYYKRGLLHDLSKYTPKEIYLRRYYQGYRSPIEAEKEEKGYSFAWQHHKGHNPHHWEHWIEWGSKGEVIPLKIPFEYMIEMLCDWVAAKIIYSKADVDYGKPYAGPLEYYEAKKGGRHYYPATRRVLEMYLRVIADHGIDYFCREVREHGGETRARYESGAFDTDNN